MSKGLDSDQEQCCASPDLGPNCLKRVSADDKSRSWKGKKYPLKTLNLIKKNTFIP